MGWVSLQREQFKSDTVSEVCLKYNSLSLHMCVCVYMYITCMCVYDCSLIVKASWFPAEIILQCLYLDSSIKPFSLNLPCLYLTGLWHQGDNYPPFFCRNHSDRRKALEIVSYSRLRTAAFQMSRGGRQAFSLSLAAWQAGTELSFNEIFVFSFCSFPCVQMHKAGSSEVPRFKRWESRETLPTDGEPLAHEESL